MIIFGIENNIPEAVRLGEHMLGENGQSLSFEMAKAVKKYRLQHNVKYMEAMKRTGPINTMSVYMNNRMPGTDGSAATSIVNMDDPYWHDFYERNYRSQDKYKLPSIYAWDYKEHGLIGELIDIKKLERNLEEFKRM